MTVLPSPGRDDFDPTDERVVERVANGFFGADPRVSDLAASPPSGVQRRAAPVGTNQPTELTDPWHHAAPGRGRPMISEAPSVESLRELDRVIQWDPVTHPTSGPVWPSMAPEGTSSSLYFLEPRSAAGPAAGAGTGAPRRSSASSLRPAY